MPRRKGKSPRRRGTPSSDLPDLDNISLNDVEEESDNNNQPRVVRLFEDPDAQRELLEAIHRGDGPNHITTPESSQSIVDEDEDEEIEYMDYPTGMFSMIDERRVSHHLLYRLDP